MSGIEWTKNSRDANEVLFVPNGKLAPMKEHKLIPAERECECIAKPCQEKKVKIHKRRNEKAARAQTRKQLKVQKAETFVVES